MRYDPANAARCRWEGGEVDPHAKTAAELARNPYAAPKHYRPGHAHDTLWLKWWMDAYHIPIDAFPAFERQMAGRNHYEFEKCVEAFNRRLAALAARGVSGSASASSATADRAAALRAGLKPPRRRPPPPPVARPSEMPGSPHRPASRSDQTAGGPPRAPCAHPATTGGVGLGTDERGDSYPDGSIIGASSGTIAAHQKSMDGRRAGELGERGKAKAPSSGALSVDVDGIPPPSDADWEGRED